MKSKFPVVALLLILFALFWKWWLPGPKVANDFPMVSDALLKASMNFPYTWLGSGADGLGEYGTFFLWSWPLSFISGSLAHAGVNFLILERLIFFLPFLLIGSIGIWKFCSSVNMTSAAKFISSLFYLTTTYILLVADGGQLSIALTYAWFPIAFLEVEKAIAGGVRQKIVAGLAVSVLGFLDFRFIYILALLSLALFFYQLLLSSEKRIYVLSSWISSGVIISLVVGGLNAYWLLPLLKAPVHSSAIAFFTQNSFLALGNLGHSILLLSPHWYKNIFGNITQLRPEFILIPILVFLAPVLRPKNQMIGFWLLIAVFSIFLAKGSAEPLAVVYPWLFSHLPGFSLFRDSTKFFFLVALSYSLLLGTTVDGVLLVLSKFTKLRTLFLILLTGYLIFLVRPVWLGQMTGTFAQPLLEKEFTNFSQFLSADSSFSQIFWIPSFPALGYSSLQHPRVEASRLVEKRPFVIGTKGTYETFNFLREAPFMGEIFDVAGIGYIAYPYLDPNRSNLYPDNIKYYYTFLDQLGKRSWLTKVDNSSIPLFKTKQHQDKFFITPNVWWIIGSDSLYQEATSNARLALAKNALIFAQETLGLGQEIDQLPEAKIVLNHKTSLDFAATFIDPKYLIFPAKSLNSSPDKSGWWRRMSTDLVEWRSFLQEKYKLDTLDFDLGGGWAVAEHSLKLKIPIEKFKKDNVLLARVMESSRSGELSFYQNDNLVGEVTTKTGKEANVRWFEIGQLAEDGGVLEISSLGDINVVNSIAVLERDKWLNYQNKAKSFEKRIINFDGKNTTNTDTAAVTYKQINPTKYIVTVAGLSQPEFLVFSQNYDNLWQLNGEPSLPIYSLLNGFRIDHNGDYVVEFTAQKYVYHGLIISFVTVLMLILALFKTSKAS